MTSPAVPLHDLFLRGSQRVHDVAPNAMLQMRAKSIARALKFIETKA